MALSAVEVRVLGALVEKACTTPESYPLSIQALVTACNQKTSREPVTDLHQQEIQEALARLRDRGLAATIQEIRDRVPKHQHRLGEAMDLNERELAVLSVLMLRGEQTPGELRARTERYGASLDLAAVEETLQSLAGRSAPLVTNRGRAPGRSQDRWSHTLGADEERLQPRVRSTKPRRTDDAGLEARIAELEERVDALEAAAGTVVATASDS
jgi:uncharacterized protein